MLTHLDLCSGIGGFAIAANANGYTTIGFCEIDLFCQRVLRKHWPETPIHDDLRTLSGRIVHGWIDQGRAIHDTDQRREHEGESVRPGRDGTVNAGLGLITAGYPCQPFSQAGKRLGEADDRHLWPAIAALVAELRPAQCLFENVAGHITLGLDRVLADLEEIGYACRPIVVPACAVNAPHRRDRVWIMAHARSERRQQVTGSAHGNEGTDEGWTSEDNHIAQRHGQSNGTRTVAHATDGGIRRGSASGQAVFAAFGGEALADPDAFRRGRWQDDEREKPTERDGDSVSGWWDAEPELGRVAHGIPNRVDRLKSLGNSIVPQVAAEIIGVMRLAAA